MNYGLIYGIYAVIVVGAIGITSCIKLLVKKFTNNGVNTLWEYLLSVISFVLAAGCDFCWLYFFGGYTSVPYFCVMCALAGTSTYIIYLLLFQSTRKAGLALIKRIASKITGKEFTEAIAQTAKDGDTSAETAQQVTEALTGHDRIKQVLALYGENTDDTDGSDGK